MKWWRRRRTVEAGADRAARAVDRLLWERRFERFALLALVGLYLLGFHTQQQTDDKLKATADRLAMVTTQTNDSLCALKDDVRGRVERGEQFLKDHPHGAFGISANTLRLSLVGPKHTLAALSGLHCPPEKLP